MTFTTSCIDPIDLRVTEISHDVVVQYSDNQQQHHLVNRYA